MTRLVAPVIVAVSLLAGGLPAVSPAAAGPRDPAGPSVYVGELTRAQFATLHRAGLDREDVVVAGTGEAGRRDGRIGIEVVTTDTHADRLRAQGVDLHVKQIGGLTARERLAAEARDGYRVFRPYSGPGGIREELLTIARDHPGLVKLVKIGESVSGKDILAAKVTRHARYLPDGTRPAVLYSAAQHAREWITPEVVRRLLHHYLAGYGSDPAISEIVDTTELWFVPVANPDGYDWTFQPDQRLWRKNLRDNDGDGAITNVDGVDLNRNLPYRWGYDNEGSSPDFASQTYRGPAPASEPETRALDGLLDRVGFTHMINYHSAAELLLYGVGWQVATPSPDDLVYQEMAGTDESPAIPGYDPDIAAELYTTNGETTEHAHNAYGTLAFTPEMSTCQTASASDPGDAFEPGDCVSAFTFPDSEELVQAEFEKNIPFAQAVAGSAHDPADPVPAAGTAGTGVPDFRVDAFDVSYGTPQPVAVTARRDLHVLRLHYRVRGGPRHQAPVREWAGGERYGDEGDVYFAEYRGTVRGAAPGDDVEVWFSAVKPGAGQVQSDRFTYHVAGEAATAGAGGARRGGGAGRRVLVLANEDLNGVNPDYPESVDAPKYARDYVGALAESGFDPASWDVSAQGVPHHLGVLEHFDAVVWYLGDNRLTQDPEDAVTQTPIGDLPDAAVAERQQDLTLAVRDYLNAGGKLLHTGETAAYYGRLGTLLGGIWYGLDGAPQQDCVVTDDLFSDCLLLADDFSQYYLGAFARSTLAHPQGLSGTRDPLAGASAPFGGPAVRDNPLDEAGVFVVTSDVLPPEEFPQFASSAVVAYDAGTGSPFDPTEGAWYAGALHADDSYMRLARTIDLADSTAADAPKLEFALSFDTEPGYDNVIVEVHTAGRNDWTTLPDVGGRGDSEPPTECAAGFHLGLHPWLEHYITPGDPCRAGGTTGEWHRFTGDSGGWQQVAFDLSAYAGRQVEVSVSYVTDPGSGGVGVFVDDTRVTAGGRRVEAEDFETGLGAWSIPGPPEGSPPNAGDFSRSEGFVGAGVATEDSVLLGFGLEQVAAPAERADLTGRIMRHLLAP
ncbi:MAG: M14 family zinc carboxypeptidase [Streptomycetales bacterium]